MFGSKSTLNIVAIVGAKNSWARMKLNEISSIVSFFSKVHKLSINWSKWTCARWRITLNFQNLVGRSLQEWSIWKAPACQSIKHIYWHYWRRIPKMKLLKLWMVSSLRPHRWKLRKTMWRSRAETQKIPALWSQMLWHTKEHLFNTTSNEVVPPPVKNLKVISSGIRSQLLTSIQVMTSRKQT